MKKLLVLINILLLNNLYANDSWVKSAGGSYTLLEDKHQNVKMVSEKIKIDLYNNYYEMYIEFVFYNYGDSIELMVGFPEYSYGTGEITNIKNFETSINNEIVEVEMIRNDNETSIIKLWYVKSVIFEANKYTVSRVYYRADYANHGFYNAVEYLYGTGSTWKDKIDQIKIEVVNRGDYWLKSLFFKTEYTLIRKNNNTIEIQVNDIYPSVNDTFSISFSSFPAFEMPPYRITEARWRFNRQILTSEELVLLNNEQLRILRNSIYAYHGYRFKSVDLQNYFNKQDWYMINNNFTENSFSANEKINIENIIREENRRE
jgi:hypothetical protein